jgi:hypothetical protein
MVVCRQSGSLSVGRRDSSLLNLLFFPSRLIFYFSGGSLMDSTVPADLLKLKDRLESWRTTRKYARQPIPDEFRQAAADMALGAAQRLSFVLGGRDQRLPSELHQCRRLIQIIEPAAARGRTIVSLR